MEIRFIDQSHVGRKSIFYVGGTYAGRPGKTHICNQMYVEAYEPREIKHPYPLILFHGAGQTNVNWMITPDGRMGWADYFVANGYCVYLAEQPSRGRSAYHPEDNGPRIYHCVEDLTRRFTSDQGEWPQAVLHSQWPGSANADDPATMQFLSSQVEYLASNRESQQLVLEAGQALLKLTGPAILLTHSQAGPFGWLLADACPDLVKGIVSLEPSGPPFSNDLSDPRAKNFGIADLPLHYEPAVSSEGDFSLKLHVADVDGLSDGWVLQEPAPQLTRLSGIPIVILTGEASYHQTYDHLTSHVLRQCGVAHEFVRLQDVGIRGNGHMMMLEKNNIEIADFILSWLDSHIV